MGQLTWQRVFRLRRLRNVLTTFLHPVFFSPSTPFHLHIFASANSTSVIWLVVKMSNTTTCPLGHQLLPKTYCTTCWPTGGLAPNSQGIPMPVPPPFPHPYPYRPPFQYWTPTGPCLQPRTMPSTQAYASQTQYVPTTGPYAPQAQYGPSTGPYVSQHQYVPSTGPYAPQAQYVSNFQAPLPGVQPTASKMPTSVAYDSHNPTNTLQTPAELQAGIHTQHHTQSQIPPIPQTHESTAFPVPTYSAQTGVQNLPMQRLETNSPPASSHDSASNLASATASQSDSLQHATLLTAQTLTEQTHDPTQPNAQNDNIAQSLNAGNRVHASVPTVTPEVQPVTPPTPQRVRCLDHGRDQLCPKCPSNTSHSAPPAVEHDTGSTNTGHQIVGRHSHTSTAYATASFSHPSRRRGNPQPKHPTR